MLVRPEFEGLTDEEREGWHTIMRNAWNKVRRTMPAGFALALVKADKATLAHVAAQCDPATTPPRLARLQLACDEARAAHRQADKVLMHDYGEHSLEMGKKKLRELSTAIQERLEEPEQVTEWADREHDRAAALHPHTSPEDAAAYLNKLERARVGHAFARYLVALADEAVDFLRLRASETGPGTRAVKRGSALGEIRERSNEDLGPVEDDEVETGERRHSAHAGMERARARARVTGARRPQSQAQTRNETCRVQ
ncbi:hypothetical protein JCM9279_006263 [Rhodotorula babjevae]